MKYKNSKLRITKYSAYGGQITSLAFLFLLFASTLFLVSCSPKKDPLKTVIVARGDIIAQISTTGTVMPRNRLEIKPPIAGRVDKVLVDEGQWVKKGQVLAWMSSSERAALLDAAYSEGEESLVYWKQVYKAAPIIAPLNGFIIKREVEAGQSVSTDDAILVMADRLIVKAQVDETDIGGIKLGQKAQIVIDAYPDEEIAGKVGHIDYESQIVNNVTIYEVDVVPKTTPSFLRSGMSATVNFILSEKKDVLMLPLTVVKAANGNSNVFLKVDDAKDPKLVRITTGVEGTTSVEVVSGLAHEDEVLVPTAKMMEQLRNNHRRRPFNPFEKKKK